MYDSPPLNQTQTQQTQTQMAGNSSGYISMPKRRLSYKQFDRNTKNPSPRTVGQTDKRMKWQQYPLASMSAEGKSSEYISMLNFMPFFPCALSANEHKPENTVNERTDGQTDGRMERQTGGLRDIPMSPQLGTGQDVVRNENWKNVLKSLSFGYCDLDFDLWPWKVNQVRPLSLPMFQIWEKLIQGVLSYRIYMITVGGEPSFNMKPIISADPSDSGDIIDRLKRCGGK